MAIEVQISRVIDVLNQRDFDALEALFDDDAALDMPDGQRVIGVSSLRDTLSAFLLRHGITFANGVVMTETSGSRGAVDATIEGRDGGAAGEGKDFSLPCVLVFEHENGRFTRLSLYLSTPL
ncbi:SnoaL-like domain-containing protein [Rhizobium sp. S-51]|jgi:hypothetical protein|uniref:SnoaL-like domain-containing protein n=1 Tax=Rhizobium terricola TaxID=2728849 RepID=A0A7Y0ATB1_9HYPH|nr:nuclear transport factor 2 family protein [Rhizobium terricola]NML73058.1 SnoaL-like domain-containing protein [Rhizobium terricola]